MTITTITTPFLVDSPEQQLRAGQSSADNSLAFHTILETSGIEISSSNPLPVTLSASGSSNSTTVAVTVTPTVTASNSYGTNYVVGGLLTFTNAFGAAGSGILQGVVVTINKVETSGFTFVPFSANPSSTTWTDAAVANINSADVSKVRAPIALSAYSGLGTHTVAYAAGLGEPIITGSTTLYGVLIANAALTNQFSTTSDVSITIQILQD